MPNIEALQQLRRVVENAPNELFHMRTLVEQAPCGTARCAFGWCLIDPWFLENTEIETTVTTISNRILMDFYKAAEIFDISDDDAHKLFGAGISYRYGPHSVSKEEVLNNIDNLLAGHSALPYTASQFHYIFNLPQ
jgi:hypothetical protein